MAEDLTQPPTTTPDKKHSGIYSIRPKGEMLDFLNSLIEKEGSAAKALEYCIRQAMQGAKPKPTPAPAPSPTPAPPAPSPSGFKFTEQELMVLDKVSKYKKVDQRQAVTHCIVYTGKNDWL